MPSTQKKEQQMCTRERCSQTLPDYKKLAVPRTLQGFYAKKNGCPCISKVAWNKSHILHMNSNMPIRDCGGMRAAKDYRAYAPGPHDVYPADNVPVEETFVRDQKTGARLFFPNARNYGGTVTQHKFPAIGAPKQKTYAEKKYDRMHDRKEFLRAVLRDEIRDRLSAEEELAQYENELCLRGSRHVRRLEIEAAKRNIDVTDDYEKPKTIAEQYDEIMEELRYVTRQPVGSKVNIIRLYYLLEEQERLRYIAERERKEKEQGGNGKTNKMKKDGVAGL